MEAFYIVKKIDIPYATLENTETKTEVFIALDLLPLDIDVGTLLKRENFSYTIVK